MLVYVKYECFVMQMVYVCVLVCSSFLISVCVFIVSKSFAHVECYRDCSRERGGRHGGWW